MTSFSESGTIVLTCYPEITDYLSAELTELGYEPVEKAKTSITIKGNLNDCINLNFHLRTASRVLFNLHSFPCNTMEQLYNGIYALPWEKYLNIDGYFSVTSSSNHPEVRNTMFLNMRVKDAIADRFSKNFGKRPDSGGSKHGFSVHVLWRTDTAIVSIDTSGESLSKHGYRLHPFKAPLQESLAAAMIMASGWDKKTPFINPMCGSGTLAIEAALMAAGIFPGSFREHYAFMDIKGYEKESLEAIRAQSHKKQITDNGPVIIATDRDPAALEAARNNAAEAGVDHMIRFEKCDFSDTPMPEGPAVIMINPPYGTRLGETDELLALYTGIGEFFKKRCAGKTGFVLTSEKELAAKIGLKASRRIPFINADIECRLLKYEMYEGSRKQKSPEA